MWGGFARFVGKVRPLSRDAGPARPAPAAATRRDELRMKALEREMAFLKDYARRLEDGDVAAEARIFRAARLEPGWEPPVLPQGTRLVPKVVRERFVGTGLTREQSFALEANCLMRLNRPGVARGQFPILARLDPDGFGLSVVWAGRSLDSLHEAGERVVVPDLAEQVDAIVEGLERAGVVHLDLHASGKNLVVDDDGRLTLVDYGSAVLDRTPWSARMRDRLEEFDAEGGYAGTARRLVRMVARCRGVRLLVLVLDGLAVVGLDGAWPGLGRAG